MSNQASENAKEIFLKAIEIESSRRESFLQQKCGGNTGLRLRVDALILAHESPESLLDREAPSLDETSTAPTIDYPVLEKVGTKIGSYTLREQLGAGGMGVVWAADRSSPIQQRVAIKVIKPGMDSAQILARFRAEKDTLALMDHPNIAKVLDAGTTEQGRPFFVMELIRGVPITEYCDNHKLDLRNRIALLMQTCKAVQHAHQKGIIHRDIKPSNILVGEKDGEPIVKVIDFGVAKALHGNTPGSTVYSGLFQAIGTLAYMSPEQAGLSVDDLDTRADVYCLGVLLYELLTGTTPFDRQQLEQAALDEACRVIRETEPPRPSHRISGLDAKQETVSHQRKTDPKLLVRNLKGDLDKVVMKAMSKDRTLRYESPSSLAADLGRYLNHQPVDANSLTLVYRLRKLWAANRTAISVSLMVFLLLATSTAITSWQAKELRRRYEELTQSKNDLQQKTDEAESESKRANEENRKQKETLYTLLMKSTQDAWDRGFIKETRKKLALFADDHVAEDLRGFEWYYLNRKLDEVAGHQLYLGPREPMSLSVADNGLMSVAQRGLINIFDLKTGQFLKDRNYPSKRDNSIYLTSGERNYWSFLFACISKDGNLVAYPNPENVDVLRLTNMESGKSIDLPGHGQTVRCACFSPDGKRLVSGDHAGTVRVWNTETGDLEKSQKLHSYLIWSIKVSPDNQWIASGGAGNRICLWGLSDDEHFYLDGHFDRPSTIEGVTSLAFSPQGDLLASGGADRTVRIWDIGSRLPVKVFTGHTDEVRSVAFSPDGRTIASGGRDYIVRLWDVPEKRLRAELRGLEATIRSIAFSPDGSRVLAASSNHSIVEWKAQIDNVDTLWADRAVTDLALSDDGTRLAAIQLESKTVRLWKIDPHQPQRKPWTIELDSPGIAVDLSHRELAATLEKNGTLSLWQTSPDRSVRLNKIPGRVPRSWEGGVRDSEALEFSRDGKSLAVGWGDGEVWLVDVSDGGYSILKGHENQIESLVFSPSGNELVTSSIDGPVLVWNLDTLKSRVLIAERDRRTVDFSHEGILAVGGTSGLTLFEFDKAGEEPIVQHFALKGSVEAVFLDANTLVLNGEGIGKEIGDIVLWDLQKKKERFTIQGRTWAVECTAASSDGKVLAAGSWNGSVRIYRR